MADTSQRKARRTPYNSVSLIEKNKEGASIAQGNEVAQNTYNVIRSEEISFTNAENFNQSESTYFTNANQTYNEAEKLLQALESKKATLSYTASFNSNEYTLNARTATVSELIANGIEQDLQDKTAYLSPKDIEDNFVAQFVAPATNTGSATFRIQKYDGTYHTTLTAKKYNGTSLVNLVADDIKQNQLYTLVIISGELVVFGIQPNFLQTQQRITLSYNSATRLDYSAGSFIFDDFSGNGFVNAGSVNITDFYPTPANNTGYYVFAVYNPTTNASQVIISNNKTNPALPAGFTKKKYIGALMTNGTGQIRNGKWIDGNKRFEYASRSFDHTIATPVATRTLYALMAPPFTHAIFNATINDADDVNPDVIFTSYWQTDLAPTQTNGLSDFANGGLAANSIQLTRELNSASQIYVRTDAIATATLYLTTLGWVDYTI